MATNKSSWRIAIAGQALIKRDVRVGWSDPHLELNRWIRSADAAFTNLEGAVRGRHGGTPWKSEPTIIEPAALDALADMGFNMLSLSNNHAYDLQEDGIRSTLEEVAARRFIHAGIGANATSARRAGSGSCGGARVALIAADCGPYPDIMYAADDPPHAGVNRLLIVPGEPTATIASTSLAAFVDSIRRAATEHDMVLVYLHSHHWSRDTKGPHDWMRDLAGRCIDAGGHAVVIHGIPVLHGIEMVRGRPVFHSMGNLIFHSVKPKFWRERMGPLPWQSAVAICEFDLTAGALTGMEIRAVRVGGDRGEPCSEHSACDDAACFADAPDADDILTRLAHMSNAMGTPLRPDARASRLVL